MIDLEMLRNATIVLTEFVRVANAEVAEIRKGDVQTALEQWFLTREDYRALDEIRKGLNELLEGMSRNTLPDMMGEQNTKTIKLISIGYRFTVNQRATCSMLDKDRGIGWLDENVPGEGNQPSALAPRTVNAQTLAAFAKKWVQDDGKDLPEDIFKLSFVNHVSATKV